MNAKTSAATAAPPRARGRRPVPQPASAPRRVHLEYRDPRARSVHVAGSFNDWHPAVTEMLEVEPGCWVKDLTLPPGRHEYLLVVDGTWKIDPGCPDRTPNPFGGENSLLRVGA
jgi:1,4-alpha-glucan branching enzyme